jgi:hypothetical protein
VCLMYSLHCLLGGRRIRVGTLELALALVTVGQTHILARQASSGSSRRTRRTFWASCVPAGCLPAPGGAGTAAGSMQHLEVPPLNSPAV